MSGVRALGSLRACRVIVMSSVSPPAGQGPSHPKSPALLGPSIADSGTLPSSMLTAVGSMPATIQYTTWSSPSSEVIVTASSAVSGGTCAHPGGGERWWPARVWVSGIGPPGVKAGLETVNTAGAAVVLVVVDVGAGLVTPEGGSRSSVPEDPHARSTPANTATVAS